LAPSRILDVFEYKLGRFDRISRIFNEQRVRFAKTREKARHTAKKEQRGILVRVFRKARKAQPFWTKLDEFCSLRMVAHATFVEQNAPTWFQN
jgi:hypothetical protein